MLHKTTSVDSLTPVERQQLEADYTFKRVVELELNPVRGGFDAAHLKEINRRIFQDLPGAGFKDVTPGKFRPEAPEGKDWIKNRALFTVGGSFYVAYSRMDEAAQARLDKALESADPEKMRGLKTAEFTASIAKLYTELDYIHPFSDGNSRTLRTFTKQLANEAGYELDWTRFAGSNVGRDLLYIARDLSVNALAKPHIQHQVTMRDILSTTDRLGNNRDLPNLLLDAVRPSRAVAFERLPETEALQEHPDLAPAYKTLRDASIYFASKMPNDRKLQQETLSAVKNQIQYGLNKGEISNFKAVGSAPEKQRHAGSHEQPTPGPEHER